MIHQSLCTVYLDEYYRILIKITNAIACGAQLNKNIKKSDLITKTTP